MRRAALLLALVTGLAIAGNAAGSSTGKTTRHPIPTAGISLATPSSWRAVDSRAVLASPGVQALLKENPQLAAIINQVAGANSPVKFLSFDPKVTNHFATNVNVVVTEKKIELKQAVFFDTNKATIKPVAEQPADSMGCAC